MPEETIHIPSNKSTPTHQTIYPPIVHYSPPSGLLRGKTSRISVNNNPCDINNTHHNSMTFESAISISVEKDSKANFEQVETPDTPRFYSTAVPSTDSQLIHKKNKKKRIYINLPLDMACLINFLVTGIIAYGYYSFIQIHYRWLARLHTMICIVVMTGHAILYTGCWLYFELAYLVYYIFGMYYHHKLHLLLFLGHLGVPSIYGLILLMKDPEQNASVDNDSPTHKMLKFCGVHLVCSGCFYCLNFVYQRLKIPDQFRHQILYQ